MDLWNLVGQQINGFLNNFCNKIHDTNYQKWINYNYVLKNKDIEDVYRDLIYDISKIIAEKIYKKDYIIHFENKNKIYIFNNNGTISNLVAWKYATNFDKVILIRYGFGCKIRYIEIDINIVKFFSENY